MPERNLFAYQNGKSYFYTNGIDYELDSNNPEAIGKLIIKIIAKQLLEEL